MRVIVGDSFAQAYGNICHEVLNNPEYTCSPRGLECREITNAIIEISNPYSNLFKNSVRDLPLKYLRDELKLYFQGRRDIDGFEKASKFWSKIANKDIVNSAYGYLIFKKLNNENKTQWQWVLHSLLRDRDTRQAVMFLCGPEFQYDSNKDFVCTLNYSFYIRDNKLNMIVNRRSQDIVLGITYDVPWEMLLMQQLCNHINCTIDKGHPVVEMGSYLLHCNSLHVYANNFELVEGMLNNEFIADEIPRISELYPLIYTDGCITTDMRQACHGKYEGDDSFLNWIQK